jgi:pyridinium-3,5-bisthiocarboxylic acid mononucleotide nickel chelatase
MTLEIHLDPLGGIAGDMFVAALLHWRPDLEAGLKRTLALCPLIEDVETQSPAHDDGVLTGRRFLVRREAHDHHHHHHVAWRRIREALTGSRLDGRTIQHALGIFTHLAEAEARVHGVPPDAVEFHEVGAWDSIADIVAAAWLIGEIGAARWTVAALPLGGGRVRSAHGFLPVPAPATALLIEGFATLDDGVSGERVTPTGAAILRHLCDPAAAPVRVARRLVGSGHGFGTRKLPGMSNCLRALAFETAEGAVSERVAVLECEIDDQTGEDLAQALERLRALPFVLDVVQAPVFGKKGRMMTHLRVLARPEAREAALAAIFEETTTIGVRHALMERTALARAAETVEIDGRAMRRKRVARAAGATVKAEADDLGGAGGQAARAALRRRVEEAE